MGIINFNEEQAGAAGVGSGVQESGAYVGLIYAQWITATTGTKGIEFSLRGAQEANYLTCYYAKADGTEIKGGLNIIQAIMGLVGARELTERILTNQAGEQIKVVPELNAKPIGLVLQKVLTTKNDGTDGYKFEIKMPFNDNTNQTYKEFKERQPPQTVEKILSTLTDRDERRAITNAPINGYDTHAEQPKSKLQQYGNGSGMSNEAITDDELGAFFGE